MYRGAGGGDDSGAGASVPRWHAGGSFFCTGIGFARCRRSGRCSGAPGGAREGAGSSPEGLRGSFRVQNGSKMGRSRVVLRIQRTRRSVSKTTRVLGEIDLSCPILSFPVHDFLFCAGNDEPWFENTSNSCVATALSSFGISLLGGRRMWPQASRIRRPRGPACGSIVIRLVLRLQ